MRGPVYSTGVTLGGKKIVAVWCVVRQLNNGIKVGTIWKFCKMQTKF